MSVRALGVRRVLGADRDQLQGRQPEHRQHTAGDADSAEPRAAGRTGHPQPCHHTACIEAGQTTIEGLEQQITNILGDRGHRQLRNLLSKLLENPWPGGQLRASAMDDRAFCR